MFSNISDLGRTIPSQKILSMKHFSMGLLDHMYMWSLATGACISFPKDDF